MKNVPSAIQIILKIFKNLFKLHHLVSVHDIKRITKIMTTIFLLLLPLPCNEFLLQHNSCSERQKKNKIEKEFR